MRATCTSVIEKKKSQSHFTNNTIQLKEFLFVCRPIVSCLILSSFRVIEYFFLFLVTTFAAYAFIDSLYLLKMFQDDVSHPLEFVYMQSKLESSLKITRAYKNKNYVMYFDKLWKAYIVVCVVKQF